MRFTEGEVSFPEGAYENTAPLEEILFETQQLKIALASSGVFALSLVCPGWRHLEAPQYDIDGNEIDVEQMVDFTDVYRLEWNGSTPPEQIGFRLRTFNQVVYGDLMPLMHLHYDPPNDPLFVGQWGLHNTGQTHPDSFLCIADHDINALEAWDIQDTSIVKVGILDIGIDKDHEDLSNAVDPYLWFGDDDGQEMYESWPHGSAVAGIVGATGGNARGISGAASPKGGAFLVPMRGTPPGDPSGIDGGVAANALAWACSNPVFPQIRIVNNSWGGNKQMMELQGFFKSVRDAFRNAYLKGLFLTASAGNNVNLPEFPAAFSDYTTAVGSILCDGSHPAGYIISDYIDVVAPGGQVAANEDSVDHVKTTWGDGPSGSNDSYWGMGGKPHFGGTSASAAFVAGVAALVWSVPTLANTLTNDDVDGLLKATARDSGEVGPDPTFGHGFVRGDSALILISPPNRIMQNKASPVRIDYVASLDPREFMNIPCITQEPEVAEELTAHKYEMVAYAPFAEPALAVWTRGRQTNGWRDIVAPPVADVSGPIDGLAYWNWAEVDSGTVTAEGCSLRSYTYEFFRNGQSVGWYPVDGSAGQPTCMAFPKPASFAYTYVVGGSNPLTGELPKLQLRIQGPALSNGDYRFSWIMQKRDWVDASIFDVSGRRLRRLFSGSAGPGEVRLTWDGRNSAGRRLPAGIYFLKISAGSLAHARKLLVVAEGGGPR